MADISILVVGPTQRDEFREAAAMLRGLGRVVEAGDVATAAVAITDEQIAPDIIVVAQSYPGQFSPEAIDGLRRLAPVARLLGLLGSWCEGEMRTGDPWPAAIRVYWHQWLPRVDHELRTLRSGDCPGWGLPLTAGEDERLLAVDHPPPSGHRGPVAICTWRYEMHDWLAEACRRAGHSTLWLRPGEPIHVDGAAAAIFDAGECEPPEVWQLQHLVTGLANVPVLVLLDFPRIEDLRRARAAGAAAVLSKPLLLEDFYWELDRAVGA